MKSNFIYNFELKNLNNVSLLYKNKVNGLNVNIYTDHLLKLLQKVKSTNSLKNLNEYYQMLLLRNNNILPSYNKKNKTNELQGIPGGLAPDVDPLESGACERLLEFIKNTLLIKDKHSMMELLKILILIMEDSTFNTNKLMLRNRCNLIIKLILGVPPNSQTQPPPDSRSNLYIKKSNPILNNKINYF